MIKVRNLTKLYGTVKAIDNLNFDVKAGEIVGFLGPNGAGKTTTMRILTCFMPATSGDVQVAGFDVFENAYEVKKQIGYLPEVPPLYGEMTVRTYLTYVAKLKQVERSHISQAVNRVIERCHLAEVQNRITGHLSKGYRQRVGLAQALVHDPKLLILDEPTVGLDPKQIIEIRQLIRELSGDHTVLLSTHILPEVAQTCQRIIIINEGKIVAVDTYAELSQQLRKTDKIELHLQKMEGAISKLKAIPGVIEVSAIPNQEHALLVECQVDEAIRNKISKTVVEQNLGLLEMKVQTYSMEDVFLKLTTDEKGTAS
ncbi:MAG: ABC transporter ATP-binding protein [Deltaproteobacteria bacterium]|nr:ABC transporter ATP-binding protein [Deltaproteobacteria bacterium]